MSEFVKSVARQMEESGIPQYLDQADIERLATVAAMATIRTIRDDVWHIVRPLSILHSESWSPAKHIASRIETAINDRMNEVEAM